jgi:adhesin/invasin
VFITLRALAPNPLTSTITADSAALNADGESSTLVTVRILDEHGNPVGASAGLVALTLAEPLGTLSAVTDHNDGTYTATFTAGTAIGIAEITGTLNGEQIGDTAFVKIRPLAGDPTTTTMVADSTSILADGVSFTTVTVSVLDVHGNPVGSTAGVVTLVSTHGILSGVTDNNDGTYTATLRGGVPPSSSSSISASMLIRVHPDTAVVTGTLNGEAIAGIVRVELRPPGLLQTSLLLQDQRTTGAGNHGGAAVAALPPRRRDVQPDPRQAMLSISLRGDYC